MSGLSRRRFLEYGAVTGLSFALSACSKYPNCQVEWQPNVREPVFSGYQDYGTKDDAPGDLRVFYPTAAPLWSGAGAPILTGCGHYPLVAFAHGFCDEGGSHYLRWRRLPGGLARSGYIVVVPRLPATEIGIAPWEDPHPDLELLKQVLKWMRQGWESSPLLYYPKTTGIVGHSYGALLAFRLALEVPASAYASLSGVWAGWPASPPTPLKSLGIPKLFTWGTSFDEADATLEGEAAFLWKGVQPFKHSVRFEGSDHWGYLGKTKTTCMSDSGPCDILVEDLAADFVTTFMSKYTPADDSSYVKDLVPDTLVPPPIQPTKNGAPFLGGHLNGLSDFSSQKTCKVVETWVSASGPGGPVTLP